MMFRVVHTSPKRALGHLRRLRAEGEGLLGEAEVGMLTEAFWSDRVFRYLQRIAVDPGTFDRMMWHDVVTLPPPEEYRPPKTTEEHSRAQRQAVQKTLITLTGAIEQLEAQYEHEI
jgi:hypothetical protein